MSHLVSAELKMQAIRSVFPFVVLGVKVKPVGERKIAFNDNVPAAPEPGCLNLYTRLSPSWGDPPGELMVFDPLAKLTLTKVVNAEVDKYSEESVNAAVPNVPPAAVSKLELTTVAANVVPVKLPAFDEPPLAGGEYMGILSQG